MTFKDQAALIISGFALLVSSTTLYLTQFRTSYRLEAVVLAADPLGGVLSYQVALLNQGTHRVIITDAYLKQEHSNNVLYVESPFSLVKRTPDLPAVIGAQDLLVLSFKGPLVLPLMYERGDPPDGGGHDEFNGQPTRKVTVCARITGMDFLGREYQLNIGAVQFHTNKVAVSSTSDLERKRAFFERTSTSRVGVQRGGGVCGDS